MLVLNNRFALLASLLTFVVLSTAPTPSHGAAIRMRQDSSDSPTTTTLTDGTTYTQNPLHQDRPSELGLPDGAEPASSASRNGMSGGGRWNASRTRTWTGTRTWARPTSTAPASDNGDGSDELSKREFRDSDLVSKYSHRRHHARRSSQRGHAAGHRSASSKLPRRSISMDSEKGDHYVVQKDRARTPSSAYRQRRFMMRRKNQRGTPGVINIMASLYPTHSFVLRLIASLQSHVNNAQPGKKIASLYLESEKQNEQYVLNASEKDSTEVYLVPTVPPAGGSLTAHRRDTFKQEMLVSLRMQIENHEYCATYDPNPPEAEPLTMQPCMSVADESDDAQAAKDVEAGKDRDPDNHKSQTFSFNQDSGVIRPMWFAAEEDGKIDDAHAEDTPDDTTSSLVSSASPSPTASDTDDSLSSSAASSAVATEDTSVPTSATASPSSRSASAPSPTSTSTIATRDVSSAQNVTLVFVPSSKPSAAAANAVGDAPSSSLFASVPLPSASSASGDNETASPSQTASAASDDSEATSTLTMTVTVTASNSDSPMPTVTPDAAAKDASGDGASSTTTITISSAAPPTPTASKGGEAGSLSVQVVGDDGKTVGDDDPSTSTPPMDNDADSASSASAPAGAVAETSVSSSSASAAAPTAPVPPSAPVPAITGAPIPSLVNPMAVASSVAQSWSASQSASASAASSTQSSATPSQTTPDAFKSEVVAVKSSKMINSRIARRMTPVSTAPYKWLFKFGGI